MCNVDSVLLSSDRRQQETHNWSTGATTSSIYVQNAGMFYDTIVWNGCIIIDTFNVIEPGAALGNDTSVCFNQPFVLDVTTPGATYIWQDNSTKSAFSVVEPGTYWVSIKTASCIITDTINISGQVPLFESVSATLCAGQTYTLPGGEIVISAGIYKDTIRYENGCDSLISVTNLSLMAVKDSLINVSVCSGEKYTLPWGGVADSAGTYTHVLQSITGCDSLKFTVNLGVNQVTGNSLSATICSGEDYTLPSGKIVNQTGLYYDTIPYQSGGCDSLITTVNLALNPVVQSEESITICAGETYTLLSGKVVNTSARYIDTLSYVSGCDSIISITNLTVSPFKEVESSQSICAGQSYTLPWGEVVHSEGIYSNIIKTAGGCDSIKNTINVSVKNVINDHVYTTICTGQNFALPSGKTVSSAGVYRDTIRYHSGCDSLVTLVEINENTVSRVSENKVICEGSYFTMPSGKKIYQSGLYRDTLHYAGGCDSLVTTIDLKMNSVKRENRNETVCEGKAYTLPSGKILTISGIYADTLRYQQGCDSLISTINFNVISVKKVSVNPSVCQGEKYTMPSGASVSIAGSYTDILKSKYGCDSVITYVTLKVNQVPYINLRKSNDISCMETTATLFAGGGTAYQWWPAESLSNPTASNPVATPSETTTYKVRASLGDNCYSEDSIRVVVNKGNAEGSFLLPNSFTPNNDGLNDCFGAKHWGAVTDFKLTIFNRFGNIIFSTVNPSECWDGTYKGRPVDLGVYLYQVSATTICGPVFRKGTVTVLR